MGNSDKNTRIARNTLFLYVRMGVIMLITLYTSRVFLRTLGVVDFGIFNVVAGFVSMFTFLNSAMSSSIQRFFSYEMGKSKTEGVGNVFTTAIYSQLLLACIIILLVESVGIWYLENKMVIPIERMPIARGVFQVSVISILFVIMGVPYSGAIMAHEKMDYYAFVGIVDVLLKLGIALVLPFISFDKLLIYAILLLFTTIVSFLMYVIYVSKNLVECKFGKHFDKSLFKSMMSFSGWHAMSAAGTMMGNQGVNMILNLFYGPVVNAARGISYQINSAIMGFVRNITMAARPQMIQSYSEGNKQRSLHLMYSISKICFLSCLAMLLPICLEIKAILGVWLGDDCIPEYASIFTIWVLLTSLLSTLDTPVTTLVHATGRIRNYHLMSTLISLLVLPVGYLVLRNTSTPVSIFILMFFSVVIGQGVGLILLKHVFSYSIKEYFGKVVKPLFFTIVFSLIVPCLLFNYLEGWCRFLLVIVSSIVSVLTFSYIIGLDASEKQLVRDIISKVINKSSR